MGTEIRSQAISNQKSIELLLVTQKQFRVIYRLQIIIIKELLYHCSSAFCCMHAMTFTQFTFTFFTIVTDGNYEGTKSFDISGFDRNPIVSSLTIQYTASHMLW